MNIITRANAKSFLTFHLYDMSTIYYYIQINLASKT
jgi:hypothetical protein